MDTFATPRTLIKNLPLGDPQEYYQKKNEYVTGFLNSFNLLIREIVESLDNYSDQVKEIKARVRYQTWISPLCLADRRAWTSQIRTSQFKRKAERRRNEKGEITE